MNIALLAYNAGFRGEALVTAVAIAYAESGGNPSNYNPETAANTPNGMGSVGLWQIYRKAHPDLAHMDLLDPQVNANAAFEVYKQAGYSFHPWSTYQHGSHKKFLDRAAKEVSALDARSAVSKVIGTILGVIGLGALAKKMGIGK